MKNRNALLGMGLCAALGMLAAGVVERSNAAGSGPSESWAPAQREDLPSEAMRLYDQGVQADKAGDDKAALEFFRKALKKDKKNPDIINMLAHSERKLGMLNEAIEDYWTALKLRPRFPEAREYMGEAYIQAALKEIETLKSYGKDGEEQRETLVKAFKDAAAKLEAGETGEKKK